jgi:hypothetical protein
LFKERAVAESRVLRRAGCVISSLVNLIGSGKFIGSVYDWVENPGGEVVRSHPRISTFRWQRTRKDP